MLWKCVWLMNVDVDRVMMERGNGHECDRRIKDGNLTLINFSQCKW
jgi:hypothetical protein